MRADSRSLERLPRGSDAIYLIDPLGNQVLAWPPNPDVRGDWGDALAATGLAYRDEGYGFIYVNP